MRPNGLRYSSSHSVLSENVRQSFFHQGFGGIGLGTINAIIFYFIIESHDEIDLLPA